MGFDVFAAETFSHGQSSNGEPAFRARFGHGGDGVFTDAHGYFSREAMFGRLVHRVRALGYRLVPYEQRFDPERVVPEDPIAEIEQREEAQAENLIANVLTDEPDARVLVHVGYGHVREAPLTFGEGEVKFFAAQLKEKTGIDPLTINQTICRTDGQGLRFARPPEAADPKGNDLFLDVPVDHFVQHRPAFRLERGDRVVPIPAALLPEEGWRIIEAWSEDQDLREVPIDRVAVCSGEEVALMLPPGRYRVRAVTP